MRCIEAGDMDEYGWMTVEGDPKPYKKGRA